MIKNLLLAACLAAATISLHAQCTTWVNPTSESGWVDLSTPPCTGEVFEEDGFEILQSEAYVMTLIAGGVYRFSHCNGPGAGAWIPEYTILAPSGAIDAFGPGDGDGCSITWTAGEDGDYLVVINEAGNCGVAGTVNNGHPQVETISGGVDCPEPPVMVFGAESFEGGVIPDCWQSIDADGDDNEWNVVELSPSFNGSFAIRSESFINGVGALSPDNYLITPQLMLETGDSLYFVVRALDPGFSAESYSVLISTTGSEIADFTDLVFAETLESTQWQGRSIDLSAYDNQSIYIAFRHFEVTDQFAFVLDAVALPGTVVCDILGVDDAQNIHLQTYPNPVNDQLSISTSLEGNATLRMIDALGRTVLVQNQGLNGSTLVLDLHHIESGLYTLEVTTDQGRVTQKIIKR